VKEVNNLDYKSPDVLEDDNCVATASVKEVNNADFEAVNGTGDEEYIVDTCCDTECEIPASQFSKSELHCDLREPDKSSSDCNLSSSRSFDVYFACDIRQGSDTDPNSDLTSYECSDTDSDSDLSSSECSDTDFDYNPSSSECSNTDSDCEIDDSDNGETSDNGNDVMMWPDPVSVQKHLKQHKTNMRLHKIP
jgi:hypothetical protein